jgi:hypothetical protein
VGVGVGVGAVGANGVGVMGVLRQRLLTLFALKLSDLSSVLAIIYVGNRGLHRL